MSKFKNATRVVGGGGGKFAIGNKVDLAFKEQNEKNNKQNTNIDAQANYKLWAELKKEIEAQRERGE